MIRVALAGLLAFWALGAEAACRQALALGLDVSGSVDAAEYRVQLDGLANALNHPEVVAAFLALPDAPVSLAVFEWSGPDAQRVILPWRIVSGGADLQAAADALRAVRRVSMGPSTAIGAAKRFGAGMLSAQPECWRHVLDLSGDGESNTGPQPHAVRPSGITVNGLVIGAEPAPLVGYFRAYVIQGPHAFVEQAHGFPDYEAAMIRKLKRELQIAVVSAR